MTLDTHTEHNQKHPINEIEVDADYVPTVTDNYENYTEEIPESVSQYIAHLERKITLSKKEISINVDALEATGHGLASKLKKVLINLKRE